LGSFGPFFNAAPDVRVVEKVFFKRPNNNNDSKPSELFALLIFKVSDIEA